MLFVSLFSFSCHAAVDLLNNLHVCGGDVLLYTSGGPLCERANNIVGTVLFQ